MQLQNLATSDYYAPVKISSRFIPCRPCLPARAFYQKYPSGEGIIQGDDHDAWCRVPPGESGISIRTRDYPRTDC